jgi:hypothetical protein
LFNKLEPRLKNKHAAGQAYELALLQFIDPLALPFANQTNHQTFVNLRERVRDQFLCSIIFSKKDTVC